ncbi:MAG: NHL repeat-containing protein [Armatimonadota bacterium]|nr:MAG: NHL repeat-containing protein [Armatimonadota bacterium]
MKARASRILSSPNVLALFILGMIGLLMVAKVVARVPEFGAVDLVAMCLPLAMLVPAVRQFARRRWRGGILSVLAIPALVFFAMIAVFLGWGFLKATRPAVWYSASAELPDGLGQVTFSYRSALPPSFFPVPGGEVVCKVEVRPPHGEAQTVDLGYQSWLPDLTVSVVQADSPVLHLSYGDQSRYIDAVSGHLLEGADGPERKLGMFWRDHAIGGVRFVRYEERPSIHGGLAAPYAVAVGGDGRIYVADEAYAVLLVYSPAGEFLQRRSLPGPYGGYDIATDGDENLWLVQWGQPELRKYAPDGRMLAEHKEPFDCASGLAIARNGDVYVSDIVSLVYRISPDGDVLARWGLARGDPPRAPRVKYAFCGIAVSPDGNVLVADRNAGRIRVYSSDGDQLRVWKVRTGSLLNAGAPTDVAADQAGAVYAPVWAKDELHIEQFTAAGRFVRRWASGIGKQQRAPVRIAVSDRWVYVVDRASGRVRRFTKDGKQAPGW